MSDVFGTIDQNFGFSATLTGRRTVLGSISKSFGFTATLTGRRTVRGTIVRNFGFTATIIGREIHYGSITKSFGFTPSVIGVVDPVRIIPPEWTSSSSVNTPTMRRGKQRLLEPDETVWGDSTGYTARVDVLTSNGDIVASTATAESGIVLVSGKVTEDISQVVTRECSIRLLLETQDDGERHPLLPAKPGDPLDPRSGGSLAVYAGPTLPSGTPAWVKLGVFRLVAASPSSGATGDSLTLRGLSQESAVSVVPFFDAYNVTAGTLTTSVIQDMVVQALPNASIHMESSSVTLNESSWGDSENRMGAVSDLAASLGMSARFDRDGRLRVLRLPDVADLSELAPRWTFTEGDGAVMRTVSRDIDDSQLFNGVIVIGEPLDSVNPAVRAERWDTDPSSPTYYNPSNPGASRMGPRPKKIVSPLIYTQQQAEDLCAATLAQVLTAADQITVSVTANPSIEAGDVVRVVRTTMGVNGLYRVERVEHDLMGAGSNVTCVAGSSGAQGGPIARLARAVAAQTGKKNPSLTEAIRTGTITNVDTSTDALMVDIMGDAGFAKRRGRWGGDFLPVVGDEVSYLDQSPIVRVFHRSAKTSETTPKPVDSDEVIFDPFDYVNGVLGTGGTSFGSYRLVSEWVLVTIHIVIGVGGYPGFYIYGLPSPYPGNAGTLLPASLEYSGTPAGFAANTYAVVARLAVYPGYSSFQVMRTQTVGGNVLLTNDGTSVTSTHPFTWNAGSRIKVEGSYRRAT